MASLAREKLIQTAITLFKKQGIHATGIDQIIAQAGVAKMTLYNHFRSKEDLILAALRRWDEDSRRWITREIEARATTPRQRVLALFDVLEEWFLQSDFTGCLFINASAEYTPRDDPIHAVAAEHKGLLRRYLLLQVEQLGVPDADALTDQVVLLMEGSIVTAHVSAQAGSAALAKSAARALLDQGALQEVSNGKA